MINLATCTHWMPSTLCSAPPVPGCKLYTTQNVLVRHHAISRRLLHADINFAGFLCKASGPCDMELLQPLPKVAIAPVPVGCERLDST
jgi:hypothetical protein